MTREAVRVHPGDGRPQAMRERCSTCVFRPGNPMRLAAGRLAEIVDANRAAGAVLTCHQTLSYGEHPGVGQSACRGFLDAYPDTTAAQLADRLFGGWRLVDCGPPVRGDRRMRR